MKIKTPTKTLKKPLKFQTFTPSFNLFLLIILTTTIPTTLSTSNLSSSKSALLTLSSTLGGRTHLWNTSNTNPCSWLGIQCQNNTISGLHLPAFSLYGKIPHGIFTNLTSLKTLSLRFNKLSGNLPSDLALCTELRNLYLQDNEFEGEILEVLSGSLKNLVRVNLGNNKFSGEVPVSLKNLKRLKTLYLQDNKFSGFLPELKLEFDQFNVSNNGLNGSIPVSLSSMSVTSFQGTKLCGKPLQICPGIAAGTGILTGEQNRKKKGLSGGAIAGIVIGAVVAFAIILMIIVLVCGRKRSKRSNGIDLSSINKRSGPDAPEETFVGDAENGGLGSGYAASAVPVAAVTTNGSSIGEEVNGGSVSKKLVFFGDGIGGKMFDLEELLRASAEVLGKGTFGTAYKAVLEMGTVVTVKRLKDVILGEKEFKEKIEAVGAMEHENLVRLRAYYYSRDEKLLVFDYMSMGSLSSFLHGNKGAGRTPLTWEMRSSIALGVARGINYLHSQGSDVSHGNIKASNVLLASNYEPRMSDFGLAQLVGPPSIPTTRVNGYRAPEVTEPRRVSQKADVYSFGVLLLELLTGKAPTHALLNEEGVDLPRWVQSVVKDDWAHEVFDFELLRYQHAEEEMVQLLQLAVDCAGQYPDSRPSMQEVTSCIERLCRPSLREESDPKPTLFVDVNDEPSR